jgi:Flp pilus assembly protein TadD
MPAPGSRYFFGVWLALSVLLMACGGAPDAARTASPTNDATTDTTAGLIEQARDAESRREYLEAQALYQRAKEIAPDAARRAFAARIYGRALIFYGEYQRALAELEEAARLQADDAGTWHDLGMLWHHDREYVRAEQAFREAIRLAPKDPRSRIAVAALLVERKRYPEAIEAYRALLGLHPPENMRAQIEAAIEMLERERADVRP